MDSLSGNGRIRITLDYMDNDGTVVSSVDVFQPIAIPECIHRFQLDDMFKVMSYVMESSYIDLVKKCRDEYNFSLHDALETELKSVIRQNKIEDIIDGNN